MARGRVYKRGSTWSYRIDGPLDPATGKRQQIGKGGFRTKRDAEDALSIAKYELDTGQHVRRRRTLVETYFREWLPTQVSRLAPSTIKAYRIASDRIIRHLGQMPLQALTPELVEQFHEDLRDEGLAPKTVLNTHHVLQAALRDATRKGLVFQNAAAMAQTPPNSREEPPTLSPHELQVVIDHIDDPTLKAVVQVASRTGLRRGEIVALRYNDLDLDAKTLRVDSSLTAVGGDLIEGQPKTKKSRRVVAIDDETAEVLRAHRHRADQLRAALDEEPCSQDDFVFTRPDLSPIHPDGLSSRFSNVISRLSTEYEVPLVTFHCLRHTHATHCLEAGINPKAVADRLGHTSVATTLDLYSHITPATSVLVAHQVSEYIAKKRA